MIDTITEQQSSVPNEFEKYKIAVKSDIQLEDDIANLRDADITSENAAFIAGLYLGRTKEISYLGNFVIERGQEEDPERWITKSVRERRLHVGNLQETMMKAQDGNFVQMKQFIKKRSEQHKQTSEDSNKNGQLEWAEKFRKLSEKLDIISEKMPDTGDGSMVKTPNPAWMEEPIPLRIQLQMLKEGKL